MISIFMITKNFLNMKNKILLTILLLLSITAYSQKKDSIAFEKLKFRVEKLEGFQSNIKDALNNKFEEQRKKNQDDYNLLKRFGITALGLTFFSIIGLWWRGSKYIDKQLKNKFDNIINQKEGSILDIINNQDEEKRILKNKKILVLTSENGDDSFLRKFFKQVDFSIGNVKYIKENSFDKSYLKDIDLVFANNEKGDLDIELIKEYFSNSSSKTVLFYFNSTQRHYRQDNVSNRLSFANTKTQIYGNLINLLKYQKVL